MRLELHFDMLETTDAEWRQYIQQIAIPAKRKEEEDKYAQMVDEKTDALHALDALQSVRGYDITPENYDVIRKVLKFGQSHTIKRSLYNELHWIKKNDREWRVTVEAIERILRQLEAMGEN
ncbi:unnamed protein product, partial [Onchocerca ochengi]|uniref:Phage protein n=1 Tax=Onchocerca ochengi TaxID=42157 RepID=A0A182EYU2_ONCOC